MRIDAGLRQAELAERLGASQSFVSKYERGERQLEFVEVKRICAALGVKLADFVRRFEGGR